MPNEIRPLPMLGGVNLLADPSKIQDAELVKSVNVVPVIPGVPQTRLAIEALQSDSGSGDGRVGQNPSGGIPIAAVVSPYRGPFDGVVMLKGCATSAVPGTLGLRVVPFVFGYNGSVYTGAGVTAQEFGENTAPIGRPAMVAFGGRIYIFAGMEYPMPGKYVDVTGIPTHHPAFPDPVDFAFAGVGNTNIFPRVATVYRRRMAYGNLGLGYEDCVLIADPDDPTLVGDNALAVDGRSFRLSSGIGDRVVGMIEMTQTEIGSPSESTLLVLKEYSGYVITGEPNLTTGGTSTLKINRIAFNCGCISAESIVQTPYGIFWVSTDDVWFFAVGAMPIRVGSKIRPAIQRIAANARWLVHAAYQNGFLRIALAGEGQSIAGESFEGLKDQFWLDLRDGAPQSHEDARWWGPQQFVLPTINSATGAGAAMSGTLCFADERRPNREQKLYTFVAVPGDVVPGAFTAFAFDAAPNSRDGIGIIASNLFDDLGTEINVDIYCKDCDFQDSVIDKTYQGLEVSVLASGPVAQLTGECRLDGGRLLDSRTLNVDPVGFESGVATVDSTLLSSQIQSLPFSASSDVRSVGKRLQPHIYSASGIVIDSSNNQFSFLMATGGVNTAYLATIPAGTYTIITLLDALVLAMNSASGAAITHNQGTVPRPTKVAISSVVTREWQVYLAGASDASIHKRFCDLIGFPNDGVSTSITQTGDTDTFKTLAARWEFQGATIRFRPIPRRPL